MRILNKPVFGWPIDWNQPVNGRWAFDMRQQTIGFGPELLDIKQTHVVTGLEFTCHFRHEQIDDVESFLDEVRGSAGVFWVPGPTLRFKVTGSASATTFLADERGEASGWTLTPGAFLYLRAPEGHAQVVRITGVVDNLDGTETVTFEQAQDQHETSSSSNHESASTEASFSSSSSSQSSQSPATSSSSVNESSSSSEGQTSASSGESSSSSSSGFWPVEIGWTAYRLILVRLAEDSERIELGAEKLQTRTFRLVEVPVEEEAEAPAEIASPVFLYRFVAQLADGQAVWRYTSYPTDLTLQPAELMSSSSSEILASSASSSSSSSAESQSSSSTAASVSSSSSSESKSSSSSSVSSSSSSSGANEYPDGSTYWTAVGINHSRIQRSAQNGGSVEISADIDNMEPLRLMAPMRLSGPLTVEIYETDEEFNEPVLIFSGTVKSPRTSGRKITVTAVEWNDAFESPVPNFFIQRSCNYQVYDPDTCRANRASKTYSASITAKNGRSVVLDGAALAAMAEGWLNYGWLEIGTGVTRRVYFVAESAAAVGNTVAVELTREFDQAVPVSVTAVAGCDGQRSTCIAKHNNLDNFGGHAVARDNLTLVAIRTDQTTGGKK